MIDYLQDYILLISNIVMKIPQTILDFLEKSDKEFNQKFKKYEKAILDLKKEVNIIIIEKLYMEMMFPFVKKHILHFYLIVEPYGVDSPVIEGINRFFDNLYMDEDFNKIQGRNILNSQILAIDNLRKLQKQAQEKVAIRDLNNFFELLNIKFFNKKKLDKTMLTNHIYNNYYRFEKYLKFLHPNTQKMFIQKLGNIEDKYKLQINNNRSVEINLLDFTYNNKLQENPVRYFNSDRFGFSIYILALLQRHKKDCITFKGEAVTLYWTKNNNMYFIVTKNFANSTSFKEQKKVLLKELLECKKKGLLGVIQLFLPEHANMLIYNPFKNIIEHFEPHGAYYKGVEEVFYSDLKNFWEKQTIIKGLEYTRPSLICPNLKGLQRFEKDKKSNSTDDIGELREGIKDPLGFCMVWSILYADLRLTYPRDEPNKLLKNVINKMKKKQQTIGNYGRQFIRGYAKQIEPLHKEWISLYEKLKKTDKRFKREDMATFVNEVFPSFFKAKAIEFTTGKKTDPLKWVNLTSMTQEEIDESDEETDYYDEEEDDESKFIKPRLLDKFKTNELKKIYTWFDEDEDYTLNNLLNELGIIILSEDEDELKEDLDKIFENTEEEDAELYGRFIDVMKEIFEEYEDEYEDEDEDEDEENAESKFIKPIILDKFKTNELKKIYTWFDGFRFLSFYKRDLEYTLNNLLLKLGIIILSEDEDELKENLDKIFENTEEEDAELYGRFIDVMKEIYKKYEDN